MVQENIPLQHYSNYKIGGPAKYFFEAGSVEEIIKALEKWRLLAPYHPASSRERRGGVGSGVFILGGGTNILFSDEGFDGLVIKSNIKFIEASENVLKVGAGVPITQLLDYSINKNLSGLEWAAGLPGTVGGAIRGNAGSFGGEMNNIVKEVISLDISGPKVKIIKRNNKDCDFSYRSSIFKKQPFGKRRLSEIIIEATLVLKKGDKELIREIIKKNINHRIQKQPLEYPSIGSIFKNVDAEKISKSHQEKFGLTVKTDPFPVIPSARLISESNLKGISCGGAMISPKHPNFIVNVLDATANDVKNLIKLVKNNVKKNFNVNLEEEIVYL